VTPETDPRLAVIRAAQPLVTDAAVLKAGQLAVEHLVSALEHLNRTIDDYDHQIAKLVAQHPDAPLFRSLPGAGDALTPRLVAAFGTDRQRFESAQQVQEISGIAPITVRSGKTKAVRRRAFCPKFLRQTFHEFAAHSIFASSWAQAYYRMLRARGQRHHAAIRSLAFKWIRILFRCWKDRRPYDEARYLQRLRQKNAPLLAFLKSQEVIAHT